MRRRVLLISVIWVFMLFVSMSITFAAESGRYIVINNPPFNGVAAMRITVKVPDDNEVFLLGAMNSPDWEKQLAVMKDGKISFIHPYNYYDSKMSPQIGKLTQTLYNTGRDWHTGFQTWYKRIIVHGKIFYVVLTPSPGLYDADWNRLGNVGGFDSRSGISVGKVLAKHLGYAPPLSQGERITGVWKYFADNVGIPELEYSNYRSKLHTYLNDFFGYVTVTQDLTIEQLKNAYNSYPKPKSPDQFMGQTTFIGPGGRKSCLSISVNSNNNVCNVCSTVTDRKCEGYRCYGYDPDCDSSGNVRSIVCGDNSCYQEDCLSCASDCGKCGNNHLCTSGYQCGGGYCVHNACRSTSTYCGDGFCDSPENYNSCRSDCGNAADLVVEDIRFDRSLVAYNDIVATVDVKNNGNLFATVYGVLLSVDGKSIKSYDRAQGLGVGSSYQLQYKFNLGPGRHTVKFFADGYYNVIEKNEGNNILEKSFDLSDPRKADLVVTNLEAVGELHGFKDSTIRATIKNQGDKAATVYGVLAYFEGKSEKSYDRAQGLGPGEVYSVDWTMKRDPGEYSVKFFADGYNNVVEHNELNNIKEKKFNFDEVCGSGVCYGSEDCYSCVSDCGKCSSGMSCSSSSQCSSGYCVHGTCRSNSNYCGDNYCDFGESCSSCSNDCGVCKPDIDVIDLSHGKLVANRPGQTFVDIKNVGTADAKDVTVEVYQDAIMRKRTKVDLKQGETKTLKTTYFDEGSGEHEVRVLVLGHDEHKTSLEWENSCDLPDGSSANCHCDSNADCPSSHPYCEQGEGYDACVSEDSVNVVEFRDITVHVRNYVDNSRIPWASAYVDGRKVGVSDLRGEIKFPMIIGKYFDLIVFSPAGEFCSGFSGTPIYEDQSYSVSCWYNSSIFDLDNDGFTDETENLFGTDSTDPDDNPHILVTDETNIAKSDACLRGLSSYSFDELLFSGVKGIFNKITQDVNFGINSVDSFSALLSPNDTIVVQEINKNWGISPDEIRIDKDVSLNELLFQATSVDYYSNDGSVVLIIYHEPTSEVYVARINSPQCQGAVLGVLLGTEYGLKDDVVGLTYHLPKFLIMRFVNHQDQQYRLMTGDLEGYEANETDMAEFYGTIINLSYNRKEVYQNLKRGIIGSVAEKGDRWLPGSVDFEMQRISADMDYQENSFLVENRRLAQTGFYHGFYKGYLSEQVGALLIPVSKVTQLVRLRMFFSKLGVLEARLGEALYQLARSGKLSIKAGNWIVNHGDDLKVPLTLFAQLSNKPLTVDDLQKLRNAVRLAQDSLPLEIRVLKGSDLGTAFVPVSKSHPNIGSMVDLKTGKRVYVSPNGYVNTKGVPKDITLDNLVQKTMYSIQEKITTDAEKVTFRIPGTKLLDDIVIDGEKTGALVIENVGGKIGDNPLVTAYLEYGAKIGLTFVEMNEWKRVADFFRVTDKLTPAQKELLAIRDILFHFLFLIEDNNLGNTVLSLDGRLASIDLSGGKRSLEQVMKDPRNVPTFKALMETGTHIRPDGNPNLNPSFIWLSENYKNANLEEKIRIIEVMRPKLEIIKDLSKDDVAWTILHSGISESHLKYLDDVVEEVVGENGRVTQLWNSMDVEYQILLRELGDTTPTWALGMTKHYIPKVHLNGLVDNAALLIEDGEELEGFFRAIGRIADVDGFDGLAKILATYNGDIGLINQVYHTDYLRSLGNEVLKIRHLIDTVSGPVEVADSVIRLSDGTKAIHEAKGLHNYVKIQNSLDKRTDFVNKLFGSTRSLVEKIRTAQKTAESSDLIKDVKKIILTIPANAYDDLTQLNGKTFLQELENAVEAVSDFDITIVRVPK